MSGRPSELYVLTLPLGWRRPPGWQRAFRPATGADITEGMVRRAASVFEQFVLLAGLAPEDEDCERWARAMLEASLDDQAVGCSHRAEPVSEGSAVPPPA